ncbi:MAG: hypothetical protein JXR03_03525 [Cyclobacteriaceae bacterium]
MRIFTLCLLLLIVSTYVQAQKFSSEEWHKGFIVTTNKDTIRGSVKYSIETNTILVLRNGVIQTFSSQKIFYVEIFDKLVENYRQFYTIPYNIKSDYKSPVLFELLYEGPLSLLAREQIVTETVNSVDIYGPSYSQTVLKHSYFFLDTKGKIQYYSGRKADLLIIMSKKESQVKSFIKKNKLDTNDLRDIIRITAFYNSL